MTQISVSRQIGDDRDDEALSAAIPPIGAGGVMDCVELTERTKQSRPDCSLVRRRYVMMLFIGVYEVCEHMRDLFPNTVSYNRFVELERKVAVPFILIVKKCCMGVCTGISFVDSTALRVCRNQRIHLHRVFKGLARRGQCSMGWFYGFKLHLICNEKGDLLNFMVTPGNVDDREPLRNKSFIEQIFGKLVGDKGYISKELFSRLFVDGIQLITKLKNNMKGQVMTVSDKLLLRKRALIETINDELENMARIKHSRHRSVSGFMVNLMAGLAAYSFFPKKPMIDVERVWPYENNIIQLELF